MATKEFKNLTLNPNQDVNTPKYNKTTGLLTDFGRFSGATQVNPLSNANLLDIGTLSGTNQPLVMPPPTADSSGQLGSYVENIATAAQTESDKLAETSQATADKSSLDYLAALTSSADIPESVDYTAQDQAKKVSDRLNAQIMSEAKATRDQITTLTKTFQGTTSGLQSEIGRIQSESANKQADLAIVKFVADNDYQGAAEIADRQLKMKLDKSKIYLDGLKYIADSDAAKADRAFTTTLNEKIKKEQRTYDEKVKVETEMSKIKLGIAQYAGTKSTELLNELSKIDTTQKGAVEKALAIGGKYLEDPLDRQLKQAQINSANRANQPSGGGTAQKIVSINGKDFVQNADGSFSEPNVPTTGGLKEIERLGIQDKVNSIDSAINHRGLFGAVGPNVAARSSPDFEVFTNVRGDFIATVSQLSSRETLDTLLALKKAGGTLGAVNTREFATLENSATKINNWAIVKDDKVIGYDTTEKSMKEELNKIKDITERWLKESGGEIPPEAVMSDYLNEVDGALLNTNGTYQMGGYDTN